MISQKAWPKLYAVEPFIADDMREAVKTVSS